MKRLSRRDFFKVMGLAGTAAATGCTSESSRTLIPFVIPPEDLVPGKATWYATTCRECPAGCGLLAKNREGRTVKVEGNPHHPINQGKLCARGQASLHGLYNPDRFQGPMKREKNKGLQPVTWDQGEDLLVQKLQELRENGRGKGVVFVTELVTGTLQDLATLWVKEACSGELLIYEPFTYESLLTANRIVFGKNDIPAYRLDQADFLISFGAGFLETWLSNVEYARQFGAFHAPGEKNKSCFVYVGPRHSLTAASADFEIRVQPGQEYLVALAILRAILDEHSLSHLSPQEIKVLHEAAASFTLDEVSARTGVEKRVIRTVAEQFLRASRPLAIAEGLSYSGPFATEAAVAANLLCLLVPGTRETIDFSRSASLGGAAPVARMKELAEKMKGGEIGLVLVNGANPAFTLPFSREFEEGLSHVPMVVSFSSCPDETSEAAHLMLPVHTPLESWGDYSHREGITGLMQPVTGTLFDTRHLGDILIATGKKARGEEKFPWKDFYHLLRTTWPNEVWLEALQEGGTWNLEYMPTSLSLDSSFSFAFPLPPAKKHSAEAFHFVAYPTVQFYDGRMANRPWIQELPDPITQVTWGGWVEIHPEKAREFAIEKGDLLLVASPYGSLEAPALPIPTVPPDTVAIPLGQGHRAYGRYASGVPADPLNLFPKEVDPSTGTMAREFTVTIKKLGKRHALANTDGSLTQQDRHMVETMAWEDYLKDQAGGVKPEIDLPLPQGFDPKKDFYPPHVHKEYRWCMVVDLDRCIGCGACVVACYAENNVALVGRKRVLQGREMSWLRVQRYFDEKESKARFLVMLCQHCCAAPCESVCPVFAPHHSPEGLNNQIYNRCFGTRFCSQNDPYKVRRFNYFTYTRPRPLDFQLNPDVTVRQKGVMEKCSFCIQRIVEAKMKAREQGRKKVQDGDFTTACAQTCPTNALVFGNLLEPGSRVSRLIKDTRAYQVLRRLNTKPAVIYLKKLTHPLETSEV